MMQRFLDERPHLRDCLNFHDGMGAVILFYGLLAVGLAAWGALGILLMRWNALAYLQ